MIPLIETGGSPYDIGHDVGRSQRDIIHQALATTRQEFAEESDGQAIERVGPFLAAIDTHAPLIADELRGMAAGAGVTIEDMVFLNATAELNQQAGRLTECTVAGITQAGTADGHVLVSHNEDSTAGWDQL